ncbi:MAG: hypothetical protein KGQ36_02075 [Rickettsiales bacterium]|nr:hypothetical protein [Rickettsiales bacterium]
MSKEPELTRLIILGAGASVECGFYPTGAQFIKIVRKVLEFSNALNKAKKISPELLKKLVEASPPSIDAYISSINDSKDKVRLKALILSILRVCTDYSESYSDKFINTWYFSIWQLFERELRNCGSDTEKIMKLQQIKSFKIITFNYDLSLELFLWKRIDANFVSEHEKKKAIKIISDQIFHVYGSLGDLNLRGNYFNAGHLEFDKLNSFVGCDWSDIIEPNAKDGNLIKAIIQLLDKILNRIDEEEKVNSSENVVTNLVNGIKVIETERNNDEKLDEITKLQDGWDVVYVLGYGFDRLNNERLNLSKIKWNKGCFITNFGGKKKLEKRIYEQLSRKDEGVIIRTVWKIPTMITNKSVVESLSDDFDLFEFPEKPDCIEAEKGEEPFYAMQRRGSK